MSKEEIAELYYLLGKLRYCYAEMAINNNKQLNKFNEISNKIEDILKIIPIDNKKD